MTYYSIMAWGVRRTADIVGVCSVIDTHCSVTFPQIVPSKDVLQAGSIDH